MLREEMQKKIIESMKSGDKLRVKVLRYIVSEIKYAEIEKRSDLTDEEVVILLRKEVKKRREAIEMFKKGKREDLVSDEEKQIEVIEEYLPKSLPLEELKKIVGETLKSIPDKTNTGRIIGAVMGKVKGKADGSQVAMLVKEMLA